MTGAGKNLLFFVVFFMVWPLLVLAGRLLWVVIFTLTSIYSDPAQSEWLKLAFYALDWVPMVIWTFFLASPITSAIVRVLTKKPIANASPDEDPEFEEFLKELDKK